MFSVFLLDASENFTFTASQKGKKMLNNVIGMNGLNESHRVC